MISFSETVRVHPRSSGGLLIGVPTLHRYDHLQKCLIGILAAAPNDAEIVVIDNGASFENKLTSRIQVVRPQCNLGAPASWNLIGDLADGREFMIFNDDVVPAPNTINEMLKAPGWMVCAFSFGAFLVRPLLWQTIGRFDEFLWPMYWEDTDYQARMRLAIIEDSPDDPAAIPKAPAITTNGLGRVEGGIVTVPGTGTIHLDGGSQTKQPWMGAWIDRTRNRWYRKWQHTNDPSGVIMGGINLCREPFDGDPDDPFGVYWDECHRNGWEPYMDVLLDTAQGCETVLLLGLHVGRFTLPFLRSEAVKAVHCYDWSRPDEWDFMMRLDELYGRKLHLQARYDPRRTIPEVDLMFIDEAFSNPTAKRMMLKQLSRVRKYLAFLGPDNTQCPARDEFMKDAAGWRIAHHNNGLMLFERV